MCIRDSYKADVTGGFGAEYFPTAPNIGFKIGSQVMMLNNDPKKRWVNGSMGVIESIKCIDGEETLGIRLEDNDRLAFVTRFMWEVVRFKVCLLYTSLSGSNKPALVTV